MPSAPPMLTTLDARDACFLAISIRALVSCARQCACTLTMIGPACSKCSSRAGSIESAATRTASHARVMRIISASETPPSSRPSVGPPIRSACLRWSICVTIELRCSAWILPSPMAISDENMFSICSVVRAGQMSSSSEPNSPMDRLPSRSASYFLKSPRKRACSSACTCRWCFAQSRRNWSSEPKPPSTIPPMTVHLRLSSLALALAKHASSVGSTILRSSPLVHSTMLSRSLSPCEASASSAPRYRYSHGTKSSLISVYRWKKTPLWSRVIVRSRSISARMFLRHERARVCTGSSSALSLKRASSAEKSIMRSDFLRNLSSPEYISCR
mmetsp:Transcript_25972/g.69240  ORF Transcript_25972/g.69240 Transcript_25972/m.69240 type:complete len:330 (+) Transcript_25972:185-1174(+)